MKIISDQENVVNTIRDVYNRLCCLRDIVNNKKYSAYDVFVAMSNLELRVSVLADVVYNYVCIEGCKT